MGRVLDPGACVGSGSASRKRSNLALIKLYTYNAIRFEKYVYKHIHTYLNIATLSIMFINEISGRIQIGTLK